MKFFKQDYLEEEKQASTLTEEEIKKEQKKQKMIQKIKENDIWLNQKNKKINEYKQAKMQNFIKEDTFITNLQNPPKQPSR